MLKDLMYVTAYDESFEVLRSRGAIFVEAEPTPYPFGLQMAARDPHGNRVELRQQNRP
jgi:hypothetical protein